MNENQQKTITEKVLSEIKKGKIKMKPKIYFTIKLAFSLLGFAVLALFAFYLLSFVAFVFRAKSIAPAMGFGFTGIVAGLRALPWLIILFCYLLLLLLEIMARHFSFAWKKPLLYSTLTIMAIAFLGSALLVKANLHARVFQKVRDGQMPIFNAIYSQYQNQKLPIANIQRCVVVEKTDGGIFVKNENNETYKIPFATTTKGEPTIQQGDTLQIGDGIIILKENKNDVVNTPKIKKIRKMPCDPLFMPCLPMMKR